MSGREWRKMLESWGVHQREAAQLQKAMLSAMRVVTTSLGEEYWQATVGNREKLPLEGQAKEMVEAARKASAEAG